MKTPRLPDYYFWLLMILPLSLVGWGIRLTWLHGQTWFNTLWTICQQPWQNVERLWPLVIPALLLLIVLRIGFSLVQQVQATHRLNRAFYALRQPLPPRLLHLLKANYLAPDQVVFLDLSTPHAFCLGFWQPRIWLTAGLIELLSGDELAAVLAHERHHCRQRDPLRLVIGRALKSAFFFLPLVDDLAAAAELQQEVAADQAAIAHTADDLPLLCAIQKLLKQGTTNTVPAAVPYSPFNVTEARLRRLMAIPTPAKRRVHLSKLGLNLSILTILITLASLSARPAVAHNTIISCTPEPAPIDYSPVTWLSYDSTHLGD